MSTYGDKWHFNKIKRNLTSKLVPQLPRRLATCTLLFFRSNYDRQGYVPDETFVPWAQRKYRLNRKVLVETGAMRAALRIVSQRFGLVKLEDADPKAAYHNEGTATLPKRPIIYQSKQLQKQHLALISKAMGDLFKF